jgi:hypothetical protein
MPDWVEPIIIALIGPAGLTVWDKPLTGSDIGKASFLKIAPIDG